MAEAFLVAQDLQKSFNGNKAVAGVSFTIGKGEIFGLSRTERRRQNDHDSYSLYRIGSRCRRCHHRRIFCAKKPGRSTQLDRRLSPGPGIV